MNGNRKKQLIGIDTNIFIYHFQDNPEFTSRTNVFFNNLTKAKIRAVTSIISLIELLSFSATNEEIDKIQEAFQLTPSLTVISVDLEIALRAASIRRKYGFRTADAVQLATALYAKADVFVTNDKRLKSFKEIKVKLLA